MKYISSYFWVIFLFTACQKYQPMIAEKIVQEQLDAYNARDLDRFMALFAEDIDVLEYPGGKFLSRGKEGTRALYKTLFDNSPELHSELINRIVLGNKVIDHERITGRMGKDVTELVVIYEVQKEKIFRCMVMRKE